MLGERGIQYALLGVTSVSFSIFRVFQMRGLDKFPSTNVYGS